MPSTSTNRTILNLKVTLDDLAEVFALGSPRYSQYPLPDHHLVFSCSSMGIWPATQFGFIHDDERHYVHDRSWVLDAVAAIFRGTISPRGGRFAITLDGAHRASDGTPICVFAFGA